MSGFITELLTLAIYLKVAGYQLNKKILVLKEALLRCTLVNYLYKPS